MKIFCRQCGIKLSNDIEELKDFTLLCEEDGKDYIPSGFYCMSDGDFYTGTFEKIIINIKDGVNIENHSDMSRLMVVAG